MMKIIRQIPATQITTVAVLNSSALRFTLISGSRKERAEEGVCPNRSKTQGKRGILEGY
jgi:hypothetical protein